MNTERQQANSFGIYSLWRYWALSLGSITSLMLLSLWVPKLWLPLVAFLLESLLFMLIKTNNNAKVPVCALMLFIATRVLLWSTFIMLLINTYYLFIIEPIHFEEGLANRDIPYITLLVVSPVTLEMSLWAYFRHVRLAFCVDCQIRNGVAAERGFLGAIFSKESRYQIKLLIMLSSFMTIVGWGYYFIYYSNVNINSPDRFFFIWTPMLIYILSLVYMGIRYVSIDAYYRNNAQNGPLRHGASSMIRYMIVCGDKLFLKLPDESDELESGEPTRADTPATIYIPKRQRLTDYDVEYYFKGLSGLSRAELKFLYRNDNYYADSNIYHYVCRVEQMDVIDNSRLKGQWFTMNQIDYLINTNRMAPLMRSEIMRLFTIAITSKTYNRQGHRLYKIKNYKPSIGLLDLFSSDVDYSDNVWLYVSKNNEDQPFFRLKRMWRKYVKGYEN